MKVVAVLDSGMASMAAILETRELDHNIALVVIAHPKGTPDHESCAEFCEKHELYVTLDIDYTVNGEEATDIQRMELAVGAAIGCAQETDSTHIVLGCFKEIPCSDGNHPGRIHQIRRICVDHGIGLFLPFALSLNRDVLKKAIKYGIVEKTTPKFGDSNSAAKAETSLADDVNEMNEVLEPDDPQFPNSTPHDDVAGQNETGGDPDGLQQG